ncbi:MAG: hypothetical protein Q7S27_04000 [Nanoarchaeota archaeon]|nr:hypothetical protein [Nanoarchaeota archaeon]
MSNEMNEIREEAKRLLDNFARALEKVKVQGEKIKKPHGGYRNEGSGQKADGDFRERIFSNAPEKYGDFIIAESKKWQ